MNSRERELAAIRHEIPDRIPVDAIWVENGEALAQHLHIDQDAVPDVLGLDGRLILPPYTGQTREPMNGVTFTEWGTPVDGAHSNYGTGRGYPLQGDSIREIESFPWPRAADYDYEAAAKVARELGTKYAVRGPHWKPLFCQVCDMIGMERAMVKMVSEPELFEAILEQVFIYTAEFCERFLAACGDAMPILCLGDDFATQRGMMIAPKHWRAFLKPRYAKLFNIGKRAGKVIWFHSCGDISAVLPDLIDIGMDVWETVQLHTLPFSPEKLKEEYGKHLTFFGGVNTQRLPFMSPEEVCREVIRCIEILGKGGGYICGPDHHIKPDVSAENTLALYETARSFRRPGYTRLPQDSEC